MSLQRAYNRARVSALLLAVGTLAACASAPLPEEQIALSKSAVNRAVSAEATQYAPLEMKSAQDKLLLLERAMGERDAAQSRLLAEQVEVDANLAERKAHAVKWQQQLEASRNGIQVLKQEMLQAPDAGLNSSSDDSL
ncbi:MULTISPECIES: DUF4398 domain-containing protein [unclassified Pseudomonas]|uniref:DUF4398 domain-containing protein n=1 Tax=unclassified Pseudomonas TaxID=196821 RepID=UPI002AC9259B|nr:MULTISPECIES: DUF4398 domain-containing protein [unclassified Pseudomonas]MEB0042417.1 DUF4398 domain-containing protein [Pseudomonas sp. MH10]MEB0079162.1 DUF4398 domain-containing protein [Pseudomonas sp. MH10out]MEB0092394.1 DUF4398 domain-containing protein [Pseudomonas sp. CCI4.2]MEB0102107.1 DUF4398 domain-containing protein [Pseudomonas sp. CCI3.2]MEB0122092.1 DUF4398 domain-containing protein [Pseudomonas sp. CCI1.2]